MPVRTFSIGFREPKHDEAPFARAIAAHLGTDHMELYVGPEDGLALVPGLPEMYDEPFADPSRSRPPWSAGSPARTSPWRSRAMAGTSCSPAISAIAARWTSGVACKPWPAHARRAVGGAHRSAG